MHVLIVTMNIALQLVDNYNEYCIRMAYAAELSCPAEVGEDYGSTLFRRWIPREGNCTIWRNFFSLLFVSYITPVTIVLIPHNSVLYFLQVMILIDS